MNKQLESTIEDLKQLCKKEEEKGYFTTCVSISDLYLLIDKIENRGE